MKSSLPALSTPVTCAPARLASWIANEPEPPPAPLISTRWPAATPAVPPRADRLDAPGHIRAERPAGRRAEPAEPRIQRRAPQALPVREVDRRRDDPKEHLVRGRRRRRYVVNPQRLGWAVPVVDNRPHTALSSSLEPAQRWHPDGTSTWARAAQLAQ